MTTPTLAAQLGTARLRQTIPGLTICDSGTYPHHPRAKLCIAVQVKRIAKGVNQEPHLMAEPERDTRGRLVYAVPGGGRVAL